MSYDIVQGNQLTPEAQQEALRRFVRRFTKEHKPKWAKELQRNGEPCAVQFASDAEWLANSRFHVNKDGSLSCREHGCYSNPTWPDNPELRRA